MITVVVRKGKRTGDGMSDLINRQSALDAFGLSEKTRKYGGDHSGYETMMLYEIQDILEWLPSAQPEQRWIPVSEKLPGFGQRVLVSTANFVYEAIYFDEDAGWSTYNVSFKDVDGSKILAWMPLPEPYKEEQDG